MTIHSKTVEYNDLQDTDTSDSSSYGVSIGGFSGTHPELPNGGTTTLSGSTDGHIMKGKTDATFGETTAGSTDLNPHSSGPRVSSRGDLNNTQTVSVNKKTGGINASLTIDNEAIRNPIGYTSKTLNNAKNLPSNLLETADNIKNAGIDIYDVTSVHLNGGGDRGAFEDMQSKILARQVALSTKKYKKQIEEKKSQQSVQDATQKISDEAARAFGFTDKGPEVAFYDGDSLAKDQKLAKNHKGKTIDKSQAKAFYVDGKMYINASKWDGTALRLATTISHEVGGHHIDYITNRTHNEHSAGLSQSDTQRFLGYKGVDGSGKFEDSSWVDTQRSYGAYDESNLAAGKESVVEALSVWDVTDFAVFSLSAYDAQKTWRDPNSTGWDKFKSTGFLALDTIALAPIVPSLGYVRHGSKLKHLTTTGKVGNVAGKTSAALSYANNLHEAIEGDRSYVRFSVDSAFYLTPRLAKSGSLDKIAPNITRLSRTRAVDSILGASKYTTEKVIEYHDNSESED